MKAKERRVDADLNFRANRPGRLSADAVHRLGDIRKENRTDTRLEMIQLAGNIVGRDVEEVESLTDLGLRIFCLAQSGSVGADVGNRMYSSESGCDRTNGFLLALLLKDKFDKFHRHVLKDVAQIIDMRWCLGKLDPTVLAKLFLVGERRSRLLRWRFLGDFGFGWCGGHKG